MTVNSLEIVLLTCIFVAPGFIIDGIVNSFCPIEERKEGVYLLYRHIFLWTLFQKENPYPLFDKI